MSVPAQTAEELRQERMLNNLLRDDMKQFIPYLEDDTTTDIAVLDSGEMIVSHFGTGRCFTDIFIEPYITERIIKATSSLIEQDIEWNSRFPVLEGVIPKYKARITGFVRPNVIRPELQLRMPCKCIYSLEQYVQDKRMTKEQYDVIIRTIKERGNIIVSGSTGSGKTTCTNAILKKMEEFTPDDNFYIVEDTPELQCNARMKTTLWIPKSYAAKAVEESLRFSPDRIIFGEVRSGVVMRELLDAWRTGHPGNVTTLHANDGKSTLLRIKSMLGTGDIEMANHLADVISLVVHLKKGTSGPFVDELFPVTEETDDFLTAIVQNNLG